MQAPSLHGLAYIVQALCDLSVCLFLQLTLPMANGLVGSELTKEPFRWDQRVFGIVLKIPAVEIPEPQTETTFIPTAETSPIDSMCEVTGGENYTTLWIVVICSISFVIIYGMI